MLVWLSTSLQWVCASQTPMFAWRVSRPSPGSMVKKHPFPFPAQNRRIIFFWPSIKIFIKIDTPPYPTRTGRWWTLAWKQRTLTLWGRARHQISKKNQRSMCSIDLGSKPQKYICSKEFNNSTVTNTGTMWIQPHTSEVGVCKSDFSRTPFGPRTHPYNIFTKLKKNSFRKKVYPKTVKQYFF